jgi:Transposase DDE domain
VAYTTPAEICGACALKSRCTPSPQRLVHLHLHEAALQRMLQRTTSAAMRLRPTTVAHPFATPNYQIFGYPRFLLSGEAGAQTEINLGTMAYNIKRMINVLGDCKLSTALNR